MISTTRTTFFISLLIYVISCQNPSTDQPWVVQAPADTAYCHIDVSGTSVIPNGRLISPFGTTIRIAPHPYGLAISNDGQKIATANSGNRPFSVSIIEHITSDEPQVKQIPEGALNDPDLLGAVFMGLAFSQDDRMLYVAGGQENKVFMFDPDTGEKLGEIDGNVGFDQRDYSHGYLGDMVISQDGNTLYVVDQIGFRVLVIDTRQSKVVRQLATGRYPFGIQLSPDESSLYVANVGVFEYSSLPGLTQENMKDKALDFPASAYGSQEMLEGIQSDSIEVPALGDPNAPEAFSVWEYDLQDGGKINAKIKTGFLVGQKVEGFPAVGGASPNSIVATDEYVFVSNGNNDCISVIDPVKDTVLKNIQLVLDERVEMFRGVIPFGLALSADGKTLFVAEAGINAVAVIDIPTLSVKGHIPVGWFPSKIAVSKAENKLIVANAKGYGSGPNGGPAFEVGPEGTYIGHLMKGSVTIMDIPSDEDLPELSKQVTKNNFAFVSAKDRLFEGRSEHPVPLYPGSSQSPIKHIVFISKENRTYDEVFGQLAGGKGVKEMARYGLGQSVRNRDSTASVDNADIMVNHLALAERFAISDNFYVDSDHSADGHRWLVNTYPNEWVETHVSAAYGGKRGQRANSKAPGNFAIVGASGAIYPEDYNEAGSIWDHFERNDISFFNFGFGTEMAGTLADSTMKYTGVKYLVNYPLPGPLYDRSSRTYPTYNMAIPDQFRVDQFIAEVEEKFLGEGNDFPQVLTVLLPNDHGAGDRPWAGYPYKESYMADNDLALGRIVEFLSQTPYWKHMAIFVTEDDSQDGRDHIDAHRSILMVISPYAKKNHISHYHYSFGSIFKTFWNMLGIPHQNQYDAGATDLADLFSPEPDVTPYKALAVDPKVFDPQKALDPFDEEFDWSAIIESPELDNVADFQRSHQESLSEK